MCVYKPVRWGWGCEVAYLGRRSWDPNEIKARDLLGPGHNRMFDYYANHARAKMAKDGDAFSLEIDMTLMRGLLYLPENGYIDERVSLLWIFILCT